MMAPVGGGKRWKHPDAGTLVQAFFKRIPSKPDVGMDMLLAVGYLLATLPEGAEEFHIQSQSHIVAMARDITEVEGKQWDSYVVTVIEKDERTRVLTADYTPDGLELQVVQGPWMHDVALAYALSRDGQLPNLLVMEVEEE